MEGIVGLLEIGTFFQFNRAAGYTYDNVYEKTGDGDDGKSHYRRWFKYETNGGSKRWGDCGISSTDSNLRVFVLVKEKIPLSHFFT